ncbi:MAG: type IV pilus assembly protein PilM [Kiritimatiellaeota bacterium]|nr:type IV pilus assembly protein PilM [Kiritimatiellota bacterium]
MFKNNSILALDVGASGLKLAEFAPLRSGGVELIRYVVGSLDLDPQSEGDRYTYITSTLREMLLGSGIKPGPVLVTVAGQSVFSRFVKLPPTDREKVYQIILYEAQQNVPFPIEEVVWDYQLIGSAGQELDVMLAAIKTDIIEQLLESLQKAGLQPALVDVSPMALYNAVRYNYNELPACALVVDIGARSTDLIFIEQGRVFCRSIPVAGNAITQQIQQEFNLSFADAEEMKKAHAFVAFGGAYEGHQSDVVDKVSKSVRSVMTRMHAEINRSINFYRSQQSGQQPTLLLLAGGTAIIPYTDTFLKEKLKVDVDYLNPFLNVTVANQIPAEQIGRSAHVMGQVVGLALRRCMACPIELNLMPPKVLAAAAFRRKQPMLVIALLGVIMTVAVWCGYFGKMAQLYHERLVLVQRQVQALSAVDHRLRAVEQRVKEVTVRIDKLLALADRRTQWIKVLSQVRACLPAGMTLTALKPLAPTAAADEVGALVVEGFIYRDKFGENDVPIRDFRDELRKQPLFSPDKTQEEWAPAPEAGHYKQEFRIRIELKQALRS